MKAWIEIPTKKIGEHIVASNVRLATPKEIREEKAFHKKGECRHRLVVDTAGWPYDFRHCQLCGKGLGLI